MFKIIKTLFLIIWVIDILNININMNGIQYLSAEMLDIEIPINFWFWFIFWLFVPSSNIISEERSD